MPALVISLFLLFLLPFLFGHILVTSMAKLHLSPEAGLFIAFAILLGALINIPVKPIAYAEPRELSAFAVFGLPYRFPPFRRRYTETVIAVNVGGCLVPAGLAIYEMVHLAAAGLAVVTAVACIVSTVVCYYLARPVPGIGIA